MEDRVLSSGLTTFVYKVFLPIMWTGGFATGTYTLFAGTATTMPGQRPPSPWLFLCMTLIGAAFLFWFGFTLSQVAISENEFIVKRFLRTLRVPFSEVETVSGTFLFAPEFITIRLRAAGPFGRRIRFLPSPRLTMGFSRHPLVEELRRTISNHTPPTG